MLVIGITGGLGTGKSTVLRMFRELGAHVIDADQIAREVVAPGTPGWRAVRRAFGVSVITASGAIERRALAGIVFANRRCLARLNAIMHPRVIRRLRREIACLRRDETRRGRQARLRRSRRCHVVAVEIPLLVEAGVEDLVDCVVLVEATKQQQVARLRRATGWSMTDIRRRMRAQWPLAVKRRMADAIISNTGTRAHTRRDVRILWKTLKARHG